MQPAAVPIKTPTGQQELRRRSRDLSQRHRTVLLLVDGRRSLGEVLHMALQAGAHAHHLEELIQLGLVELPNADALAALDAEETHAGALDALRVTSVDVEVHPDAPPFLSATAPAATAPPAAEPPAVKPIPVTASPANTPGAADALSAHSPTTLPAPQAAAVHASAPHADATPQAVVAQPPVDVSRVPRMTDAVTARQRADGPTAPSPKSPPQAAPPLRRKPKPVPPSNPAPEAPATRPAWLDDTAPASVQPIALDLPPTATPPVVQTEWINLPASPHGQAGGPGTETAFEPRAISDELSPPAAQSDAEPRPALFAVADHARPAPRLTEAKRVDRVRQLLLNTLGADSLLFSTLTLTRVRSAQTQKDLISLVWEIERQRAHARRSREQLLSLERARELLGMGNTLVTGDSQPAWPDTEGNA